MITYLFHILQGGARDSGEVLCVLLFSIFNRSTPGKVTHMSPIFVEILSRPQRPPSTQSLIANETAMESSALAVLDSALSFHKAHNAEEKIRFSSASSR